ncbi:MAG: macro domain-containing protein [Chloroflexota bacterium]
MSNLLVERTLASGQSLQIAQGDITLEEVDAIVNAANEHLQHGGGVAWAISKRGGDSIQKESDEWIRKHGPVTHSRPAWTSGGLLPAKYVIHAVGPVWGAGGEDDKLADAVRGSLRAADELGLASIAFPAISTGIFGFPKERAARIILKSIKEYCERENSKLKTIRLVLFDDATVNAFLEVWRAENG